MCLDLLRALDRQPACREALFAELTPALGRNPLYDRCVAGMFDAAAFTDPAQARRLAGDLARAWQAALMLRAAPPEVAAAFCAARLDQARAAGDQAFGTLPAGIDLEAIVERAMPRTSSN
jgi:putative acyl-CoA dehydrogenase